MQSGYISPIYTSLTSIKRICDEGIQETQRYFAGVDLRAPERSVSQTSEDRAGPRAHGDDRTVLPLFASLQRPRDRTRKRGQTDK